MVLRAGFSRLFQKVKVLMLFRSRLKADWHGGVVVPVIPGLKTGANLMGGAHNAIFSCYSNAWSREHGGK